jgi:outer membrane protein assembly factor BamB
MSGMSRIDPNNGSRLWKVPGDAGDYPIVAGERVIFWNYKPTDTDWRIGPVVLCVDVSSGEELWSFDVGGPIFHPTVSNGLVLFGAEDGFFYALNLTDSTLEWKTYVDLLALMVSHNRHLPKLAGYGPTVSLPMVDSKNQIIYWNMMGTSRRQDKYSGAIYSLNLTNGDLIWITPFWNTIDPYNYQETSNAILSPDLSSDSKIETIPITTIAKSNTYGEFNMALLNNKLYLSAHQELRCFDASTGSFQWNESYNERANVLWPIEAYNKVYMIADGYLRAYG